VPLKLESYYFLACGGELEAVNELIYERHKRKRVQKSPHILIRMKETAGGGAKERALISTS